MELTAKERLTKFYREIGLSKNAFEKAINVSHGYMDKLRDCPSRDKLEIIYRTFPQLNRVWLLTGEGSMFNDKDNNELQGNTMTLPLVPVDAMAGALTGDSSAIMAYECEQYIVPIFKGANFLIRVQGDSMMPRYMPGDIVACMRVEQSGMWFQWGKTYVLDTCQGALIKRIEPSKKEGCISLCSYNAKYKPFDIPTEDINAIALVVGTIRVD